jgi:hypothetical protein
MAKRYGPSTWNKNSNTYVNPSLEFTGLKPGCSHPYGCLPSLMGLLDKFWSQKLQRRIVCNIDRYASEVIGKDGATRGGHGWTPLVLEEFRAYLTICLFMGLKRLPSIHLYWSWSEPLFHCPVIFQMMTRDRYELITRCLHVANAPPHITDPSSATYDKLHKVR